MKKPVANSQTTEPQVQSASSIWIDTARVMQTAPGPQGGVQIRSGIVSGWAIGPEPFVRIDVLIGDQPIATAAIGKYRPDVAALYPAYPHAEYTGFEAKLTSGALPAGPCQIIVLAITASGKVFVKRQPLSTPSGDHDSHDNSMRTHVERCELDPAGMVCISGWAVARAPILSIQLLSNGEKIAGTMPGLLRADVAEMFPDHANADRSGFYLTGNLRVLDATKPTVLTIEVLARDGAFRRIVMTPKRVQTLTKAPERSWESFATPAVPAPEPVAEAPQQMWFFCDVVDLDTTGRCLLLGWTSAVAGVESLTARVAEHELGHARIGMARHDVARAYPDLPDGANVGFELDVTHPVGLPAGPATVHVTAILKDGTRHEFDLETTIIAPEARVSRYDDIVLGLDSLHIIAGLATTKVTGAFSLSGWAVARKGVRTVEVFLDGSSLGNAYIGVRREDLAEVFFDFADTHRAGFAISIPGRVLRDGRSQFRIIATDNDGLTHETIFDVDVEKDMSGNQRQLLRQKMPWVEIQTGLDILSSRGPRPVCDIVLRLDTRRGLPDRALASLGSLGRQAWPEWRLMLAPDDGVDGSEVLAALAKDMPDLADRLHLLGAEENSDGHGYVGILNAGDVLAIDGLLTLLLAAQPGDALLYRDDRRPDPMAPGTVAACFKPGWSPDLLLSQNYIGRAWLVRRDFLTAAGISTTDLARDGDFGAVLRLTAAVGAGGIRHVPGLMLQADGARESVASERRALNRHLRDTGLAGRVLPGAAPFLHRVARKAVRPTLVSIIIPSIGAKDHIIRCIESIRQTSGGIAVEIVVVDNLRRKGLTAEAKAWKAWFRAHADTVVEVDEPFNWSRLNNLGAKAAKGDFLLFLNDDMEVLTPDWLEVLATEAARPEVGVVGAQLLYADGKVQHAGVFLSRAEPGNARHAFRFAAGDDPCYFGLALSQRNVICVTGACMMVRRDVFEAIDGFDEAHSVVNNDIDFCLRLHRSGRLIVFTPHARLIHYELASRARIKDVFDRSAFLDTWGDLFSAGDPYLNPAISSESDDYAPEEEPLREVYAGHPLGARQEIKRILAVKLDHIGDLVTALPALRRLKALFPQAELTALVGRSAVSIAAMEPAIDRLIPFEFFDARSGLGVKKLKKADYAALEADLTARRFDLAVDLRKLGDTRHVLQHSGARLLAGFDHDQKFPWLDIALQSESDIRRLDKRTHIATDLLALVEAVGVAFSDDRRTISTATHDLPPISQALRHEFADLFAHDFVVIHPAAGTPLRQWSPSSFARLIDLLITENGMRVALIGGPDERDIAARVMATVQNKDRAFDLVGRSKLSEVPGIMAQSVLFVGNNSGPSHIASGLGVPTVAVHSALVSSEEWGPLGPSAMALRRDMSCGPCYIASVDACHRGMACLHSISPFAVHQVCERFLGLRVRL